MCLIVVRDKHPDNRPKVAKRDITVYKVIRNDDHSVIFNFEYLPNREYVLSKNFNQIGGLVSEGFHVYRLFYYPYITTKNFYGWDKAVKLTIPKGAKYYIGTCGELVSDRIVTGDLEPLTIKKWLASKLKFW